jgi:hypothetical protein
MDSSRCPSPATIASHLRAFIKSRDQLHVCNSKICNIENLLIEIHTDGERHGIRCKYVKPEKWITDETFVKRVYSIYLCKNTGKIHHCHSQCDGGRITNHDNCQVCLISGVQYESETVRSWQISSRCVPTVIQDKRDPLMFSRSEDGRLRKSGVHNIKITQCVNITKDVLKRLLFSQKRIKYEKHKYNESKRESEKNVNKYRRHCERSNKPKCYLHVMTIYISHMQSKPMFTHLIRKTPVEQEILILKYTKLVISYWKMFIDKTTAKNTSFSFRLFVPACLYIMRVGLAMSGVQIIEKSRYLESALPDANGLHLYEISKPSLTHGQKQILKAIRETVEKQICNPKSLREYSTSEFNKLSI